MIVGPSGTGKTKLLDVLMGACSQEMIQHRKYTINPKAITD
jgi:ABC-type lipoprotein export system ATPase subunit